MKPVWSQDEGSKKSLQQLDLPVSFGCVLQNALFVFWNKVYKKQAEYADKKDGMCYVKICKVDFRVSFWQCVTEYVDCELKSMKVWRKWTCQTLKEGKMLYGVLEKI